MKKVIGTLKGIDRFGKSINFSLRDGASSYKTWSGAVLTLLIYTLIFVYGIAKFEVLILREDTKQTTSLQRNAF